MILLLFPIHRKDQFIAMVWLGVTMGIVLKQNYVSTTSFMYLFTIICTLVDMLKQRSTLTILECAIVWKICHLSLVPIVRNWMLPKLLQLPTGMVLLL